MGYMAAKGGFEAIQAAEELVQRKRVECNSSWLEIDQIIERLQYSVDRVMGEGGLWDEKLAAIAFRQAEGDLIEAAHLLRSHKSTLPRLGYTEVTHVNQIDVLRRIVPAFREPPGPQLLGKTLDYTGRLLEEWDENKARTDAVEASAKHHDNKQKTFGITTNEHDKPRVPGRLLDVLRAMDAVVERRSDADPEPVDISRTPARPGAPRSSLLSTMARAETGALVQLWYRNILGPDNNINEVTLGEVRHGRLPITVLHPYTSEPVKIGHVRITEVEAIEDLDGIDEDRGRFDVGYGICFGHNERKAIAMANLDVALNREPEGSWLEQSLLMTTDGLDSSGFLEHLKLPHYVTFRSMMERKIAARKAILDSDRKGEAIKSHHALEKK